MNAALPDHWLRGSVAGVPSLLLPVAHALLQVADDVRAALDGMSEEESRAKPGGSASLTFHMLHLAGSTDRLFTYARGAPLDDHQRQRLTDEQQPESVGRDPEELIALVAGTVDSCLDQLRATDIGSLSEPREVGRAKLPSTVGGLLFHAAEHAARHAGQVVTTARWLRARRAARPTASR